MSHRWSGWPGAYFHRRLVDLHVNRCPADMTENEKQELQRQISSLTKEIQTL